MRILVTCPPPTLLLLKTPFRFLITWLELISCKCEGTLWHYLKPIKAISASLQKHLLPSIFLKNTLLISGEEKARKQELWLLRPLLVQLMCMVWMCAIWVKGLHSELFWVKSIYIIVGVCVPASVHVLRNTFYSKDGS